MSSDGLRAMYGANDSSEQEGARLNVTMLDIYIHIMSFHFPTRLVIQMQDTYRAHLLIPFFELLFPLFPFMESFPVITNHIRTAVYPSFITLFR